MKPEQTVYAVNLFYFCPELLFQDPCKETLYLVIKFEEGIESDYTVH